METFYFYLDDFILVIHLGSRERRQLLRLQILRHLFHLVDRVFRPNKEVDTNRKDPISLKKLG